ncbi:MAG: DNA-formamidopyrimidine glycosylase, partial [Candidatus Sumerlaeia bacterium]|nr:DNA-formamidopyrimidine glycosylase [Candidatus Sumerlaeia bacterium]
MPELPEVETIRRQLASHLLGNRLKSITVLCPALQRKIPRRCWQEVINQEIVGVERCGKYLVIVLASSRGTLPDKALLIHLRMTGSLVWENKACKG